MKNLAPHWPLAAIVAVVSPLLFWFCRHDGISTIGDDSVSYLILARHFSGSASPEIAPWVGMHAHFPPLFPLALAAAGAAQDLGRAHLVVAVFAILGLIAVYCYGYQLTGRRVLAASLTLIFAVMPTAWISVNGILSESMYLCISLACILWFNARLEKAGGQNWEWAIFGLLLASTVLVRVAGIALLGAYVAHAAFRVARRESDVAKLALPVLMAAAVVAAWIVARPAAGGDAYGRTAMTLLQSWQGQPELMLALGAHSLVDGWMNSFAAEGEVAALPYRGLFAVLGTAAVAGAGLRSLKNHIDGWYVLGSLAMLVLWVFDEENMRRLLYPIVPLMLAHAALALAALTRQLANGRWAGIAVAFGGAMVVTACLPAALLIAEKSRDRVPLLPGARYSASSITDYYRIVNVQRARALAAKQAAVIFGLELLAKVTSPQSRIMWARPDYVALLGERAGVPLQYRWDDRALAEAIGQEHVDFVVASAVYKADLRLQMADSMAIAERVRPYATAVLGLRNAVTGRDEFILMRIDPRRLADFLNPRA